MTNLAPVLAFKSNYAKADRVSRIANSHLPNKSIAAVVPQRCAPFFNLKAKFGALASGRQSYCRVQYHQRGGKWMALASSIHRNSVDDSNWPPHGAGARASASHYLRNSSMRKGVPTI